MDVVARGGSEIEGRSKPDHVGYSSLFLAEGIQEVARHIQGDEALRVARVKKAIRLTLEFLERADDPERDAPEAYLLSEPYMKGTRTLGHSMIPLRVATQILQNHSRLLDEHDVKTLEGIESRMIDNIMNKFHDADMDLTVEELDHHFAQLPGTRLYYLGHAIEAFWMVIEAAARQGDQNLVEAAARKLRRTADVAWDPVHGGCIRGITSDEGHNDKDMYDKVGWVQQEALTGALVVLQKSKEEDMIKWAGSYFARLHAWVRARFPLKPHGYALWLVGGDRRATFQETYSFGTAGLKSRKENYHHPRYLMFASAIAETFFSSS